jgi:hypothetical protein
MPTDLSKFTLESLAYNPEQVQKLRTLIEQKHWAINFEEVMQLAVCDLTFNLTTPQPEILEDLYAFWMILNDRLPQRYYSLTGIYELNEIEASDDYIRKYPYGVYGIFALETLIHALGVDHKEQERELLEVHRVAMAFAHMQFQRIDAITLQAEHNEHQWLMKQRKNKVNNDQIKRTKAIHSYIVEAIVFIWWQSKDPNRIKISSVLEYITAQDHSNLLDSYFNSFNVNPKNDRTSGHLNIKAKDRQSLISRVFKYLTNNKDDQSLLYLAKNKGIVTNREKLVQYWFKRDQFPEYLLILEVTMNALPNNMYGLDERFEEYKKSTQKTPYIQLPQLD